MFATPLGRRFNPLVEINCNLYAFQCDFQEPVARKPWLKGYLFYRLARIIWNMNMVTSEDRVVTNNKMSTLAPVRTRSQLTTTPLMATHEPNIVQESSVSFNWTLPRRTQQSATAAHVRKCRGPSHVWHLGSRAVCRASFREL